MRPLERIVVPSILLVASCTTGALPNPTSPTAASASKAAAQAPPATEAPAPGFVGGVSAIGPDALRHVLAKNWHPGCPVPIDDLRMVKVSYWDFADEVRTGPLIVNRQVADDVLWVFRRLFRARFPINRIDLAPRPQPIDWDSKRNLTSSFNCRSATGNPGSLSQHSYGWAIDVNPLQNPYMLLDGTVLRAAAKPYRDRSLDHRGMIHPGDVVVRSFARIGWEWGGHWHTLKDYMHFSLTGR